MFNEAVREPDELYPLLFNTCQVDAAIVRIMKTRKVLSHTLLITELFQQVKLYLLFVCMCVFTLPLSAISVKVKITFLPCIGAISHDA